MSSGKRKPNICWEKPSQEHCRKCYYRAQASVGGTCDYILVEGHRRGCRPEQCIEKGVFRPRDSGRKSHPPAQEGNNRPEKKPQPNPSKAARQQNPKEKLDSLISTAMEQFHITRPEAINRLRELTKEKQK